MAITARDVMTSDVEIARESDTVLDIAKKLAQHDVGALPICGDDNRLKGVVTDRDLVTKVLAEGRDPSTVTAGELGVGDGDTITIGADDSVDEALRTMIEHGVRRLPVIDGTELVGMVSQADVAEKADAAKVGEAIKAISGQPDNN